MSDKDEAWKTLRRMTGRYPPKWAAPEDFSASSWNDVFLNSGEYLRTRMQELAWIDSGVAVRHYCKKHRHQTEATDMYYAKGGKIPIVFYCRWCKELWTDGTVDEERLLEIKVDLRLEKQETLDEYRKAKKEKPKKLLGVF